MRLLAAPRSAAAPGWQRSAFVALVALVALVAIAAACGEPTTSGDDALTPAGSDAADSAVADGTVTDGAVADGTPADSADADGALTDGAETTAQNDGAGVDGEGDADPADGIADAAPADAMADTGAADGAAGADATPADAGPPPYVLAITAPWAGQTFAATPGGATPVAAAVKLATTPTLQAASTLSWTLALADGSQPVPQTTAPTALDTDGKAQTTLQGPIGLRKLRVVASAGTGADAVEAAAEVTVVVCPAVVQWVSVGGESPAQAMLVAGGKVEVKALVEGVSGPGASLELVSDFDGVLDKVAIVPTGTATPTAVVFKATPLTKGVHQWSLRMVGGGATCPAGAIANVQVCGAEIFEDFAKAPTGAGWVLTGAATWESTGHLELTGNAQSKAGGVYHKVLYVQPGDVRMSLKIATGGGINGGADGFAMTLLEAKSTADVDAYLALAGKGGCLGYGVSGKCGTSKVKAFHVEFDTWINAADPNDDPPGVVGNNAILGQGNHIAVHTNGDAGNALIWLPEPGKPAINIEDLQWHTVVIAVQGDQLTIRFGDAVVATKTVSGLDFRGGYVIFTGSTGWASNHHRIDDLRILHQCN